MAERQDAGATRHAHARPEHHVRPDLDLCLEHGIGRQEYGIGSDQGHAGGHGRPPQPLLQDRLGFGELRLRVDADRLDPRYLDGNARPAACARVLDHVGQVVLVLGCPELQGVEEGPGRAASNAMMPALHKPLCLSASSAWRSSTIAVQGVLRMPNGRIPQDRADACRARRRRRRPRAWLRAAGSMLPAAAAACRRTAPAPRRLGQMVAATIGAWPVPSCGSWNAIVAGCGPRSTSAATSAMSGGQDHHRIPRLQTRGQAQHVLDHRASGRQCSTFGRGDFIRVPCWRRGPPPSPENS